MTKKSRPGEGGYTMVAFVMVVAIMSIMMGVAVQAVEFQMRREREAELIFRGNQYVEAIRVFKAKYGRNPMRLKELWEAKPKVIRKKWKDPMTDSLVWGLVFEGDEQMGRGGLPGGRQVGGVGGPMPTGTPGVGNRNTGTQGGTRQVQSGDRKPVGDDEGFGLTPMGGPQIPVSGDGESDPTRIGPIIGVQTVECGESIKVYESHTDYCQWKFVFRDRQAQAGGRGRGGGRGGGRPGVGGGSRRTPRPGGRGGGGVGTTPTAHR